MSYVEKTLGRHETILYRARIHALFYIRIWALYILLTAIAAAVVYFFFSKLGLAASIALIALPALFCLYLILPLWTLEIALTNLRIVMKEGLISRTTHELELRTIEEVNLRQSFLGRIINYGTLDIRGIGDSDDLILKGVADPLAFRREIASAAQRAAQQYRGEPLRKGRDAAKSGDG